MSDIRIHARVVIREVLSPRTYRAALPNGKEILAFVKSRDVMPAYAVDDFADVLLSLCDFSEGRLVPANWRELRLGHEVVEGMGESHFFAGFCST